MWTEIPHTGQSKIVSSLSSILVCVTYLLLELFEVLLHLGLDLFDLLGRLGTCVLQFLCAIFVYAVSMSATAAVNAAAVPTCPRLLHDLCRLLLSLEERLDAC